MVRSQINLIVCVKYVKRYSIPIIKESDAIKSFVEQNQIAYGVDTLSKQWLGGSMNS